MSSFSRFHSKCSRRLPLGVLFATSPLVAPAAHAQVTSSLTSPAKTVETPLLTIEPRPTSTIATRQLAKFVVLRQKDLRSLMMAMPDPTEKVTASVAAPPKSQPVINAAPQISAPRPLESAPKPVVAMVPTPKTTSSGVVLRSKSLSTPATIPLPIAQNVVGREQAMRFSARLPARGGPVLGTPPDSLGLAPAKIVESPPVSESQRILLAQLDADLARAQKRLDRAETRLSEGQRQLGSFTGVLQNAMLEAGDDARGLHPFVRVAQRYLGTPYVWGGESARGFDCSGFIMRVMRDLGYRALPHSAAEQFHYGTPVAKGLLKPGDIVFFANTYKPGISHVGIYLGRSRFIHAANSQVGTIVSSLSEPKWIEKYAGARRLVSVKS